MQIIDISQELFSGAVYPGDMAPTRIEAAAISRGSECNLSNVSMCAHNATHIDAPLHFLNEGKDVAGVDLARCVGEAVVVSLSGVITVEEIRRKVPADCQRLLLKGDCQLPLEVIDELITRNICLLGVESQTVGMDNDIAEAHRRLLAREVVILEGLVLKAVAAGRYFLHAAPLKMAGCDGSPCRAYLTEGLL